jgi:hypothetical protein
MLSNYTSTTSSVAPCKKYMNTYPNFTPVIYNLSVNNSKAGVYTQVYISGNNFSLGSRIGYTVVNFGTYTNLPVTYYGSTNISFIVPTNAVPGIYSIQAINSFYPNSLVSNIVKYTVT